MTGISFGGVGRRKHRGRGVARRVSAPCKSCRPARVPCAALTGAAALKQIVLATPGRALRRLVLSGRRWFTSSNGYQALTSRLVLASIPAALILAAQPLLQAPLLGTDAAVAAAAVAATAAEWQVCTRAAAAAAAARQAAARQTKPDQTTPRQPLLAPACLYWLCQHHPPGACHTQSLQHSQSPACLHPQAPLRDMFAFTVLLSVFILDEPGAAAASAASAAGGALLLVRSELLLAAHHWPSMAA